MLSLHPFPGDWKEKEHGGGRRRGTIISCDYSKKIKEVNTDRRVLLDILM